MLIQDLVCEANAHAAPCLEGGENTRIHPSGRFCVKLLPGSLKYSVWAIPAGCRGCREIACLGTVTRAFPAIPPFSEAQPSILQDDLYPEKDSSFVVTVPDWEAGNARRICSQYGWKVSEL
jgi:hypothetical protein